MKDESDHDPELARLVAGELDPDSEQGRAVLEAAGLSAGELKALRDLAAELDEAARVREEVTSAADFIENPPGLDRIASTLDRLAGKPPSKSWSWLLPAAGLLLLLPLIWKWVSPPAEQLLGDGDFQVNVAGEGYYGPITIEPYETITGAEYVLSVFDGEDVTRTVPLHKYKIESFPWSDPGEQERWPPSVYLLIEHQRPGIEASPSGWVELSLD